MSSGQSFIVFLFAPTCIKTMAGVEGYPDLYIHTYIYIYIYTYKYIYIYVYI